MSIWSDIHKRSNGHALRNEDIAEYMNAWVDISRWNSIKPIKSFKPIKAFIYDTSVINPSKVTDAGIKALDTFEEMIKSRVFVPKDI